ncbi:MAG: protein kinase [Acidobacteria bacterium]|nr:protein kinase [Acidobacteriota bacterium]
MKQPDWENIKDIFSETLEIAPQERDGFLRERCNGDEALYREVRSLLDASDEPENLIEENSIDLASKILDTESDYSERHFGNYRIIREIGSGGMGTVFLAERDDGEFSMQVALKIVRQSIAGSEVINRFRQERQILAGLHHPNIAVMHDGGLSDKGEPFLAMEYVDGDEFIEYCENNDLTIPEKLRLFLKICSAVAYAHRNLVVHRDIKPSNIILTSEGEPKLLDFGLAKIFHEDQKQTQTALRAFTPAYASPEQIIGGKVSTASDQYSLGVVLFELLTGSKPFDFEGKTVDEILLSLQSSEARSPSSVISRSNGHVKNRLSRDLDNITLKALRKEPERRYGSVEALAEDIERYLDGRPVTARPNTFAYLASRFVRRNKTTVIAAVFVVLAVFTGLGIALWQAAIARAERDRAERRFQEVRQLSTSLLFEIAPKIERLSGSIDARETLVLRALDYLDKLAAESRNDESLESELARAYQKVGDLQGNPSKPNLSNFAGAIESYLKSKAIIDALPPTAEHRLMLASTMKELARIRFAQGEFQKSAEDSQTALNVFKTLADETPGDLAVKKSYVEAQIDDAHRLAINNQYDLAIPRYRTALIELDQLDPADGDVQRLTAMVTAYLANALSWDGQQLEAEAENAKAVGAAEILRSRYPSNPNIQKTVFLVYSLAGSNFESIKNDVSLKYAKTALEIARTSVEIDPSDTQARQNLGRALSRYGVTLALVKRASEAVNYLRQAEETILELIGREPRNTVYQDDLATLYTRLGDLEKTRDDLPAALAAYTRSADIFGKMATSDQANLVALRDWAQAMKSVGVTEAKLGQNEHAKRSLAAAIEAVARLKSQNALGKWDEKIFSEMQPILDKLSRERSSH